MKKILLLTIASFLTLGMYAQDNEKGNDTLKIKWSGSRIWIFPDVKVAKLDSSMKPSKPDRSDFVHWGGIDLGICMLTTIDNKLQMPQEEDAGQINNFLDLNYGKSWYISLNLFEKNIPVYKNYVNIVTGLGVEWDKYNFKKNITLNSEAEYISASNTLVAPDSIHYSKNMLRTVYLKAPLLLELNTNSKNPKKSFHIAGGIEVGYKIGSKTKQSYEVNGNDVQFKRKDDYHIAAFKYSSVLRVGYGDYFTVFANYGLSQLFEKNKGPEVFPFTAGISFNF